MRRGPIHGGIAYAEIMYCALSSRSNGVRLHGLTRRMTPGLHTTIMPLSAYSIPDGGMCGRLFIVTSGIVPLSSIHRDVDNFKPHFLPYRSTAGLCTSRTMRNSFNMMLCSLLDNILPKAIENARDLAFLKLRWL